MRECPSNPWATQTSAVMDILPVPSPPSAATPLNMLALSPALVSNRQVFAAHVTMHSDSTTLTHVTPLHMVSSTTKCSDHLTRGADAAGEVPPKPFRVWPGLVSPISVISPQIHPVLQARSLDVALCSLSSH